MNSRLCLELCEKFALFSARFRLLKPNTNVQNFYVCPISDLVFPFASFGFPNMKLALQNKQIGNIEVLDIILIVASALTWRSNSLHFFK